MSAIGEANLHQQICRSRDELSPRRAPAAVGARLHGVATALHRAPVAGAVLGVVVEGPLAPVVAAGLQARPGALLHRAVDDRQQPGEGLLHAGRVGLEAGPAVHGEAHPQAGVARRPVEPALACSSARRASRTSVARCRSATPRRSPASSSSRSVSQARSASGPESRSLPSPISMLFTNSCTHTSRPGAGCLPPGSIPVPDPCTVMCVT
jgi:hypothetical protein